MNNDRTVSRRAVLAGGVAAAGTALAGCTTRPPGSAGPVTSGSGNLPKYIPFKGVAPDLPSPNPNALDGYLTFPKERISVLPEKLGITKPVTALAPLSSWTPPPMERNPFWQNLNEQIGMTLEIALVPGPDWANRFQVSVAGDSLPELVRVPAVPQLDKVLKAKFCDLTEYLAGDAIVEYPMLANIPNATWQGALYGGRIMGVPMHLLPLQNRMEARLDITEKLGLSLDFTDGDEFLEFCRAVTDPKAKRWAMVSPFPSGYLRQMCGVPNVWQVTDGKFVNEVETEQYKLWLDVNARMWKEGLFHPQALNNPQTTDLWLAGQFVLFEVGGAGLTNGMKAFAQQAPDLKATPLVPPKFEGGGPAPAYVGSGNNGITAIRKDLPVKRVKDLLRLLNALAAPFGTAEWLAVQYGKEGVHYNWQEGVGPVSTERGPREKIVANYIPGAPMVMYSPEFPDVTRAECDYEAKVGRTALPYPTAGLYSSEDSSSGARLALKMYNASLDVIAGRAPLSGWDSLVKDWRSGGGDTIRAEYEKGYEQRPR